MIWEYDYTIRRFYLDVYINTHHWNFVSIEILCNRPLDISIFTIRFLCFEIGVYYLLDGYFPPKGKVVR